MAITDEIPKSRLTLTYRTTVEGEAEEVQLPFRVVVLGDLSGGSSRDRQVDLDRQFVGGAYLLDRCQQPVQWIDGIRLSCPIEGCRHVTRGQRQPVMEPDPVTEMENVLPAVLAHRPMVGQRRLGLTLLIDSGQALVNVAIDDVLCGFSRRG